jgi:hypothetical protein
MTALDSGAHALAALVLAVIAAIAGYVLNMRAAGLHDRREWVLVSLSSDR